MSLRQSIDKFSGVKLWGGVKEGKINFYDLSKGVATSLTNIRLVKLRYIN